MIGVLRSLSWERTLGEAVTPSGPVGLYPTDTTSVVGTPLTTTLLSASICLTLGEAAMASGPGVL